MRDETINLPSEWVSLVIPPIASFAFRGTARELTWYCLVELTPSADGIACIHELILKIYQWGNKRR